MFKFKSFCGEVKGMLQKLGEKSFFSLSGAFSFAKEKKNCDKYRTANSMLFSCAEWAKEISSRPHNGEIQTDFFPEV